MGSRRRIWICGYDCVLVLIWRLIEPDFPDPSVAKPKNYRRLAPTLPVRHEEVRYAFACFCLDYQDRVSEMGCLAQNRSCWIDEPTVWLVL